MNEKIFFILLIVFLFTSNFFIMIKNIIINGIYLFLIIYICKIINPNISKKIKSILESLLNIDENTGMKLISNLIKFIKSKLNLIENPN